MLSPEVKKGALAIFCALGSLDCGWGVLGYARILFISANTDVWAVARIVVGVSAAIAMALFAILLLIRPRTLVRYGTSLVIAVLILSFAFAALQVPNAERNAPEIYAFVIGGCAVMIFWFFIWSQVKRDIAKNDGD